MWSDSLPLLLTS